MKTRSIEIPETLFNAIQTMAPAASISPDEMAAVLLIVAMADHLPVTSNDPAQAFKGSQEAEAFAKKAESLRSGNLPTWIAPEA